MSGETQVTDILLTRLKKDGRDKCSRCKKVFVVGQKVHHTASWKHYYCESCWKSMFIG